MGRQDYRRDATVKDKEIIIRVWFYTVFAIVIFVGWFIAQAIKQEPEEETRQSLIASEQVLDIRSVAGENYSVDVNSPSSKLLIIKGADDLEKKLKEQELRAFFDPCSRDNLPQEEIIRCEDLKLATASIWKSINDGNRELSGLKSSALRLCQPSKPKSSAELMACYTKKYAEELRFSIDYYCTDLSSLFDSFSIEKCRAEREAAWAE